MVCLFIISCFFHQQKKWYSPKGESFWDLPGSLPAFATWGEGSEPGQNIDPAHISSQPVVGGAAVGCPLVPTDGEKLQGLHRVLQPKGIGSQWDNLNYVGGAREKQIDDIGIIVLCCVVLFWRLKSHVAEVIESHRKSWRVAEVIDFFQICVIAAIFYTSHVHNPHCIHNIHGTAVQVLNATAICLTFAVFLFGLVVSQERWKTERSPNPLIWWLKDVRFKGPVLRGGISISIWKGPFG